MFINLFLFFLYFFLMWTENMFHVIFFTGFAIATFFFSVGGVNPRHQTFSARRLVLIVNSRDPGEIELARRRPSLFSTVMGVGLSAAVCNCTLSRREGL